MTWSLRRKSGEKEGRMKGMSGGSFVPHRWFPFRAPEYLYLAHFSIFLWSTTPCSLTYSCSNHKCFPLQLLLWDWTSFTELKIMQVLQILITLSVIFAFCKAPKEQTVCDALISWLVGPDVLKQKKSPKYAGNHLRAATLHWENLLKVNCLKKQVWLAYSGLWAGEREEVNFSKIISGGKQPLLIGSAHSIDVRPIWAIWP